MKDIAEIFFDYNELKNKIYDYFGYVEDWVVIPLDFDAIDYSWYLDQNENGSGTVWFQDLDNDEDLYSHQIYTQRFLPKWVYRGNDYTMICVDTQTDGNKFLSIFTNSLELKEPTEAMKDYM